MGFKILTMYTSAVSSSTSQLFVVCGWDWVEYRPSSAPSWLSLRECHQSWGVAKCRSKLHGTSVFFTGEVAETSVCNFRPTTSYLLSLPATPSIWTSHVLPSTLPGGVLWFTVLGDGSQEYQCCMTPAWNIVLFSSDEQPVLHDPEYQWQEWFMNTETKLLC